MILRLMAYFRAMFPLTSWVGTWLGGVMILNLIQRLGGKSPSVDLRVITAGLATCLFTLLIRVMDEFKDYQDDLINFPDRPLPSGKVTFADLKILGWSCVAVSLLVSVWHPYVLLAAAVVIGYSYLMLKWFFFEGAIRRSLPLAFFTHHPIAFLHGGYLITVAWAAGHHRNVVDLLSVLPITLMATNWEICRKIRAPELETAYTTYSKIWGPRQAALVALILQLLVLATGMHFVYHLSHAWAWCAVYAALHLVLMLPTLRFFVSLRLSSPLRQTAEGQILWLVASLFAAIWFV